MLNPETMSKDQTKKEFARFVEDFNTGTRSLSLVFVLSTWTLIYAFASYTAA